MFSFNVSFHQENAKWWNTMCCVTSFQKISSRLKSHDLPGQGIGLALPTQHLCGRFKSSFIPKHHHTSDFQLLTPLKQNPQTERHLLAVTAKILSQPGIQLCVESVALHSRQRDFHGLQERLPWLVQHSGLSWTQITLVICQRLEK